MRHGDLLRAGPLTARVWVQLGGRDGSADADPDAAELFAADDWGDFDSTVDGPPLGVPPSGGG